MTRPLRAWTRKGSGGRKVPGGSCVVTHPLAGPWRECNNFRSHDLGEDIVDALDSDLRVKRLAVVSSGSGVLTQADPAVGYARVPSGEFAFYGAEVRVPLDADSPFFLVLPTDAYARTIEAAAVRSVAADDQLLLRSIVTSSGVNNTVVNNFFSQMNPVIGLLRSYGFEVGPSAAVVGCGRVPWAPLRLLAEGAREVFANDLLDVQDHWPPGDLALLAEALQRVSPQLAANLAAAGFGPMATERPPALVIRGGRRFEHAGLEAESVDFLFSTSVLEHVDDPEAVYAEMARVVRPGGAAYHSIDLRDHRDFDHPLAFLELSDDEYSEWDTENRLRASEHVQLLEESGYDIVHTTAQVVVGSPVRVTGSSPTTWITGAYLPTEGLPPVAVGRFDDRFRHRDPRELAILCLQVLARRR